MRHHGFKTMRYLITFLLIILVTGVTGCSQNDPILEYYLPVWKECKKPYEDFYQRNSRNMEFLEFPEAPIFHPDLVGVARITASHSARPMFPAIKCMPDSYVKGGDGDELDIDEFVDGLKSAMIISGSNNFEITIEGGSYRIYYTEE